MTAATAVNAGTRPGAPAAPSAPAQRPFGQGSWRYYEPLATDTAVPGANAIPFRHEISPGGFLRGIVFDVSSANGVLGAGVITPDAPFSVLQQISIESQNGTPIYYPMSGYSAYLIERICRPWRRDPVNDPAFSAGINPSFRIFVSLEDRATIGCVPNTDSRATYKLTYQVAPSANWLSTAPTTIPTLTIQTHLAIYAQPPTVDLSGNPFAQSPPGECLQRYLSHSIFNTNAGDSTIKSDRVGNLIRSHIMVFRDNSGSQGGVGTRIDLTGDPIRIRVDNTNRMVEYRHLNDFEYDVFNGGGPTFGVRPLGVYAWQYFHNPGEQVGDSWLETNEGTFNQWELQGAPVGGTCELITEDLVPVAPVPSWLMGL